MNELKTCEICGKPLGTQPGSRNREQAGARIGYEVRVGRKTKIAHRLICIGCNKEWTFAIDGTVVRKSEWSSTNKSIRQNRAV